MEFVSIAVVIMVMVIYHKLLFKRLRYLLKWPKMQFSTPRAIFVLFLVNSTNKLIGELCYTRKIFKIKMQKELLNLDFKEKVLLLDFCFFGSKYAYSEVKL